MLLFLARLAVAEPLELTPTPGATVEVLPAIVRGRADILVHGNAVNLHEQVNWPPTPGLRRARALNLAGDWLLVLELSDPASGVTVAPTPTGWALTIGPLAAKEAPTFGPTDVVGALAGRVDNHTCVPAPLAVRPLGGRDAGWADETLATPPHLPVWTTVEPAVVGWREVDDTRRLIAAPEADLSKLGYRLGALHRDLGHLREAAYYFSRGAAAGGEGAAPAHFQAARARLGVREWKQAEASARAAVAAGGAPEAALEVVALVAHHTGDPNAVGYARALASVALEPEAELVAASLLANGGCVGETVPLLRSVARQTDGPTRELARMLLADGHLAHGDVDAASRTYSRVHPAELSLGAQRVLRNRTRLLALLGDPPDRWASFLPDLEKAADLPDAAGLDGLFVLAQVRAHLGFSGESLDAYARLVRREPRLGAGEVGATLTAAWLERSKAFFAAGKPVEALGLHRGVWSAAVAEHLTDPQPLRDVAIAYADAGLPARALEVWQTVADLERRGGLDSRETVRHLARLYASVGDDADALDSILWLRRQPMTADENAGLLVLEGEAALASGDDARARTAWTKASGSPKHGLEAQVHLALLDADQGRCDAALPALDAAVAHAPLPEIDETLVREARIRCLLSTGRTTDASAEARAVAGLATGDTDRDLATWRARRIDGDEPGADRALLAEAASGAPGIWGELAREEAAQATFVKQLAARSQP